MKSFLDLQYARASGRSLCLDLHLPSQGVAPHPLIVWIHGGAWRAGTRQEGCPAQAATDWGYALASVTYRLTDVARFPAQIHDCKAAVRWLRANASALDLAVDRIGAWGPSAGGHLVSLLGTSGDVADLEGELGNQAFSSRVQAVCDWFGPSDLLQMSAYPSVMDHDAPDSPESQLVGGALQDHPEAADRANPIRYVTGDTPPFLIMHGTQDQTVPFNQSELLEQALRQAGVQVDLVPLGGAGHGGPAFQTREALSLVRAFFDRHLRG